MYTTITADNHYLEFDGVKLITQQSYMTISKNVKICAMILYSTNSAKHALNGVIIVQMKESLRDASLTTVYQTQENPNEDPPRAEQGD